MGMVTKVFRNGNSQAVRIPAALALDADEVEIERIGDELHIRPVRPSLAGLGACLAAFSPDFMDGIERDLEQADRESL